MLTWLFPFLNLHPSFYFLYDTALSFLLLSTTYSKHGPYNNNNKMQLATGAIFSSILLMRCVLGTPSANITNDFEEEENGNSEGKRDFVNELGIEWIGHDSNQGDIANDFDEQQHFDT